METITRRGGNSAPAIQHTGVSVLGLALIVIALVIRQQTTADLVRARQATGTLAAQ